MLCHGCFDLLHIGHVRHFRFAASQGDVLVVSVSADHRVEKGDDRPYINEQLRAEHIASLEMVDHVIVTDEDGASTLVRTLEPDVYAKGIEAAALLSGPFGSDRAFIERLGGRMAFGPTEVIRSTSHILELVDGRALESDLGPTRWEAACAAIRADPMADDDAERADGAQGPWWVIGDANPDLLEHGPPDVASALSGLEARGLTTWALTWSAQEARVHHGRDGGLHPVDLEWPPGSHAGPPGPISWAPVVATLEHALASAPAPTGILLIDGGSGLVPAVLALLPPDRPKVLVARVGPGLPAPASWPAHALRIIDERLLRLLTQDLRAPLDRLLAARPLGNAPVLTLRGPRGVVVAEPDGHTIRCPPLGWPGGLTTTAIVRVAVESARLHPVRALADLAGEAPPDEQPQDRRQAP